MLGKIYPAHIGVIMDGNGRWAKQRGLPRIEGHRQGEESIMEAVRACSSRGIHNLSLFAFSTENWERPEGEVQFLVNMSRAVLRKRMEEFMELGVRMRHIGRREGLRPEILAWFDLAAEVTAANQGLNLSINFNYGGRQEIIDSSLAAVAGLAEHGMEAIDIDEKYFRRFFYVPELPDIDLLIRTAGEMRISNYMLWHLADAEIVISPVLWPDFRRGQLEAVLREFRRRKLERDSDLD